MAEWLRRWTANQCALHAWVRIPSSSLGVAGTCQDSSGLTVVIFLSAAKVSLFRLGFNEQSSSLTLPPV